MGIEVLVPDVNESVSDFSVRDRPDGKAVRFGLSAVRNVGEGVVVHIVAAREEGGPFTDFYDFCDRVDPSVLNKRTVESLIKAGAFDSLGHPRQGLLFVYETDHRRRARASAQRGRGPVRPLLRGRRARARVGRRPPHRHPRHRVPEVAAARVREGDARALRERAPDDGRRAGAAALRRLHAVGAAGGPRGRDAHGRRDRHRAQPQVHQARRPHGHVRARGPRRRARGDGVPEDDGAATATCSRTTPSSW